MTQIDEPLGPPPAAQSGPEALIGQLRLSDLFLWTALCAVDMAIHRLVFISAEPRVVGSGMWYSALTMLYSVARGASLTVAVLWMARRRRGPYTLWPGEWLSVVSGCRALFVFAVAAIWRSPSAMSLGFLLTCWVYVIPAARAKAPRRWRLFYWLALAADVRYLANSLILRLGGSITHFAMWNLGWDLLVAGSLIALGLIDYRSGTRFPFSHWLGLAAWLWGRGLSLVSSTLLALGLR